MQKFVLKVITVGPGMGVVLRRPNVEDMYRSINIELVEKGWAQATGKWCETVD